MDGPVLTFSGEGRFRIVQFTDTHLTEGEVVPGKLEAALATMTRVLDDERPDLVVLTGDMVTAAPVYDGLDRLLAPMIERNIPWAGVLGNHDDEYSDRSRTEIIDYLSRQPLSLTRPGPPELGSGGNYVLTVQSARSASPAAALYFLDSGAYTTDRKRFGFYAWVPQERIAWYRRESRTLTEVHGGQPLPALAFFHIPLPEYREAAQAPNLVGQVHEGVCAPELNSGLFTALLECGDVMGTFVGHDHDNDFAASVRGICLAYGRKTGTFSYLNHVQPGGRIIELTEGARQFESWIRTHDGRVEFRATQPKS